MNKRIFKVISVATLLFMMPMMSVFAQANHLIKAHIPFTFVVKDKHFPAGDYTIETLYLAGSQSLKLQSADGHLTAILLIESGTAPAPDKEAKLLFTKVFEQYVLLQVFGLEERRAS